MSGTIPFSLSQQFDKFGKPLGEGRLYIIQAGTTNTPQTAYQDGALTIPYPGGSTITLDAAGRIGQFFLADGLVKIRLADKNGLTQIEADGIQVIGPSSGGGGGGAVDPTTIMATGDIKLRYGVGVLSGFVRANGRTIGSATSGATERANADTQALFEYLWNADANLAVSTGRGASANADWVANKTISLPDWRGSYIAGMGDMGNTATGVLTSAFYGANPTVLGAFGGAQSRTLGLGNLPPYTPTGTVATISALTGASASLPAAGLFFTQTATGTGFASIGTLPNATAPSIPVTGAVSSSSAFTGDPQGGSSAAFGVTPPTRVLTIYQKL